MSYPLKIFVIAGETSGDLLGGAILRALGRMTDRPLKIVGIGGDSLKNAGLGNSLIKMNDLAVMGIAEILPRLPFFIGAINKTIKAAEGFKPDIILSIDAPDFSFRVQRAICKRGNIHPKQIHVVAPSVWAWREKRAEKISKFLDGLICLFPFEPPYFTKYGLNTVAVGHPAITSSMIDADPAPLRETLNLTDRDMVLGLYLGSRAGVVERHAAPFMAALNIVAQAHPDLRVLIPTFPDYADRIRAMCKNLTLRNHVMADPLLKPVAMRACNIALAASGTVGLELAIADVPHVVGYKMNPITWWLVQKTARVKYAHLANVILDKPLVPEYLQGNCTPEKIAAGLSDLLCSQAACDIQRQGFANVRAEIGQGQAEKPAEKAAAFLLSHIS